MSTRKPLNFAQAVSRKKAAEAVEPEAPAPVTQPSNPAVQLPEPVTQPASPEPVKEPELLVTQLPSQPVTQYDESLFPSRRQRRQKSIRLPVNKLAQYEDYQFLNRRVFKDFQDMVEYALDWVTSQPVTQLPNLPNTQPSALTNNEIKTQLSFNDEKARKDMALYSELTGNALKPKDWEAYADVAHLDSAVIEQGIRQSIAKAKGTGRDVLGFRWCVFSIQDAARTPVTKPAAPIASCDLCREMSGMVYVDPENKSLGVRRCDHGQGN